MKFRSVIFVIISFFIVASIYSFSYSTTFQASAAGPIRCERTGTVKMTCCQDQVINRTPANPAGTLVTYCTDCDVSVYGEDFPTGCGERYIEMSAEEPGLPVPPSAVARLQEGGVPEEATILPDVSVNEAQRANITILPGGILQEDNTSSNDNSNNTMALDQSDLVSDTVKKPTRMVDDGAEGQDESRTTEEPSDEPVDQDMND
jgi:hypothetical protein